MVQNRREVIAIGSVGFVSVVSGCAALPIGGGESDETEQAALEEYIEGDDVYERAEDTWGNAVEYYDNEEWSQAAQEMEQAKNQYGTADDHFRNAGNMDIPSRANDLAREATDHTMAMTNSAWDYADAAAAYGSGDSQEADEKHNQGGEHYEEAQNIGSPPRINAFRNALGLS